MQKIATKVFIFSSVVFGFLGIIIVLTGMDPDEGDKGLELVITRVFMASIFIIFSSFALSVVGKYLVRK